MYRLLAIPLLCTALQHGDGPHADSSCFRNTGVVVVLKLLEVPAVLRPHLALVSFPCGPSLVLAEPEASAMRRSGAFCNVALTRGR